MSNFTDNFIFKPFDKVLVRDNEKGTWVATTYSHFVKKNKLFKHKCTDGIAHMYCIPFEKNEHLLGTNKNFYMPNKNEVILISNNTLYFTLAIFKEYDFQNNKFIVYDAINNNNKFVKQTEWDYCKPLVR